MSMNVDFCLSVPTPAVVWLTVTRRLPPEAVSVRDLRHPVPGTKLPM